MSAATRRRIKAELQTTATGRYITALLDPDALPNHESRVDAQKPSPTCKRWIKDLFRQTRGNLIWGSGLQLKRSNPCLKTRQICT